MHPTPYLRLFPYELPAWLQKVFESVTSGKAHLALCFFGASALGPLCFEDTSLCRRYFGAVSPAMGSQPKLYDSLFPDSTHLSLPAPHSPRIRQSQTGQPVFPRPEVP